MTDSGWKTWVAWLNGRDPVESLELSEAILTLRNALRSSGVSDYGAGGVLRTLFREELGDDGRDAGINLPDELADVAFACAGVLSGVGSGMECGTRDGWGRMYVATWGETFELTIADFVEDPADPIGDYPFSEKFEFPETVHEAADVLDAFLAALWESPCRHLVEGLTVDGSDSRCEAVFKYAGRPLLVRVA